MAIRSQAASSVAKFVALGLVAIALPACGTVQKSKSAMGVGDDQYREAIGAYANPEATGDRDPVAAAAFWGTRFDREPQNPEVAVKFSSALRKIGSNDEAVGVMQKISASHPQNAEVSFEFGKALIEDGRAFEAVRHLEIALQDNPRDWRRHSAYGVALDQIGQHKEARVSYDKALTMAPKSTSILNNKGLSYALDGNLLMATATFKIATGDHRADARVRQNMALVYALKGDMKESERLARSDLPPQTAQNNIDYFRNMMSQPAYWQDLADNNYSAPSFDPPAADTAPVETAPAPSIKPAPLLREEPKQEDKDNDAPIALSAPVEPTTASAPLELKPGIKDE